MGAKDVERQALNVFRMRLMGAEVVPVTSGSQTLKDALNEALRYWTESYEDTHYLIGTVAGPHPFPTIVRDFQWVIGREARAQILEAEGRLPDAVVACVGGGSNAMGIFSEFIPDKDVALVGVEPAGHGLSTDKHGATLLKGRPGCCTGRRPTSSRTSTDRSPRRTRFRRGSTHPGVGPEHAHLMTSGRATYVAATDDEALDAFQRLSRSEGIIPAFESAHAIAHALKMVAEAAQAGRETVLVVNLSGRGDKDMEQAQRLLDPGEVDMSRETVTTRYDRAFERLRQRGEGRSSPS